MTSLTPRPRSLSHLVAMAAATALLSLAACGWQIDPVASLGASLKKVCRSSESCSTHDRDPGRY